MKTWEFTLSEIVPYVRTTQRQKWCDPRYKRYASWKGNVRDVADRAMVPDTLSGNQHYVIGVTVFWKKKARADLDNCVKGVMDACWSQDRRVKMIQASYEENYGSDSIHVRVAEI